MYHWLQPKSMIERHTDDRTRIENNESRIECNKTRLGINDKVTKEGRATQNARPANREAVAARGELA